jgi:hypothetical protein
LIFNGNDFNMFNSFLVRYFFIYLILFFSGLELSGQIPSLSISDSGNYISYKSFFEKLETRDSILIFYKPGWFDNKKINSSFANLKLEEALTHVKRLNRLSYIIVDGHSYVFIPFQSSATINSNNNNSDALLVGDPNEYENIQKPLLRA